MMCQEEKTLLMVDGLFLCVLFYFMLLLNIISFKDGPFSSIFQGF